MTIAPLNLPQYDFKIKQSGDKQLIFDRLRKRYVSLTPEEWVRQNMVEFLICEKQFPAALMANEISVKANGLQRRCDTVVYDYAGHPLLAAEYKAPTITVNQGVFDQIMRYNSRLHVRYTLVSNGLTHFCCLLDYDTMNVEYLREIPYYREMTNLFLHQ